MWETIKAIIKAVKILVYLIKINDERGHIFSYNL